MEKGKRRRGGEEEERVAWRKRGGIKGGWARTRQNEMIGRNKEQNMSKGGSGSEKEGKKNKGINNGYEKGQEE